MSLDVKPQWLNVARRLQSVARKGQSGFAVITVSVLVNANGDPVRADGEPVLWTSPVVTKLEPRLANVVHILKLLSQQTMVDT